MDLILLIGLVGLFFLALRAGCGRRVRDFLHFVREALQDEWSRFR